MNYATGAAINLAELFINITKKKLKSKGKKVTLAVKVFKECLKIILNDCIDNNVTFKLPTGKIESYIYVKRYNGEQFAKLRKLGKWKDVDFLKSMFSGNQLVLEMKRRGRERIKPIYVNKKLKNKLTEYTNSGKQYC